MGALHAFFLLAHAHLPFRNVSCSTKALIIRFGCHALGFPSLKNSKKLIFIRYKITQYAVVCYSKRKWAKAPMFLVGIRKPSFPWMMSRKEAMLGVGIGRARGSLGDWHPIGEVWETKDTKIRQEKETAPCRAGVPRVEIHICTYVQLQLYKLGPLLIFSVV